MITFFCLIFKYNEQTPEQNINANAKDILWHSFDFVEKASIESNFPISLNPFGNINDQSQTSIMSKTE